MNLIDWRSSTWKTIARLRSRPRRARCSRANRRSRSPGSRMSATAAAPSANASCIVRSKIEHQKVVLAAEVEVDGPGGDPRGAGDVGDLRIEEPAFGEHVDRGAQDGVAFGALRRRRRRFARRIGPASETE